MSQSVPGSADTINRFLAELSDAHGVPTVVVDGGIRFVNYPARWACGAAFDLTEHAWQLDFRFGLSPERILCESVTGVGPTPHAKMADGMRAFAESSFHVILAAFFDKPLSHDTEREEWVIAGTPRVVSIGPVRSRLGFPLSLDATPDLRFFRYFADQMTGQQLPPGDHWLRLYQMRDGARCVTNEVLLDNNPWPAMQDKMERFDWPVMTPHPAPSSKWYHRLLRHFQRKAPLPSGTGWYDVRVFLVIRDAVVA